VEAKAPCFRGRFPSAWSTRASTRRRSAAWGPLSWAESSKQQTRPDHPSLLLIAAAFERVQPHRLDVELVAGEADHVVIADVEHEETGGVRTRRPGSRDKYGAERSVRYAGPLRRMPA
jgi:hypothetical protein